MYPRSVDSAIGKESGDRKQAFVKRATRRCRDPREVVGAGKRSGDSSEPGGGMQPDEGSAHDPTQIQRPPGVRS